MSARLPYFTSLGMFIIDEINFPDYKMDGILGGGGTFAILGSRIILGSRDSDLCSWFVDIGNDCPREILKELRILNTGGIFRFDDTRKCTRGWNGYNQNQFREFKYLTEKKRVTMADLKQYPVMLQSKSFHFVCSPRRCISLIEELHEISEDLGIVVSSPVIAWEPIPDCCSPRNLQETLDILGNIDIFTPNAAEAAMFYGEDEPVDKPNCERIASSFLKYMTKPDSGIVLRCGPLGCVVVTKNNPKPMWFPAYHKGEAKIIDPTGCGNTFVGAFATEFVKSRKNFKLAAVKATIAAGLCLEQHGLPKLTVGDNGEDLWNGEAFDTMLKKYYIENPKLA